jgi:hypothetical protein
MESIEESFGKEIYQQGQDLLAAQISAGKICRNSSVDHIGDALYAYILGVGVIGRAASRHDGKSYPGEERKQRKMTLFAAFIQSINPAEVTLFEGFYLQAAALIRQQLECLSALEELESGSRKDGKTPNVKNAPWGLNSHYGSLSKFAHSSDHIFLSNVLCLNINDHGSDTQYISLVPVFNGKLFQSLFTLHCSLVLLVAAQLLFHYQDMSGDPIVDQEYQTLIIAQKILINQGLLTQVEA